MAELSTTNSFLTGTIVQASAFNTNYSDIVTYVNNRNSGASTWDALYVTHATTVPLISNNSTGTQSIIQCQDNGTNVFEVFDGGIVSMSTQSYARATKSADQSFAGGGPETQVTFDTVTQSGSAFSVSTSRFTCPVNGKYLVCIRLCVGTSGGGSVSFDATNPYFKVKKNGTAFSSRIPNSTAESSSGLMDGEYLDIFSLSQNDYLELFIYPAAYAVGSAWVESDNARTTIQAIKLA